MPRYTRYAVLSWAESLYQILHGYHVDGGPGQPGPLLSREFGQIIAAGIVREMASHIREPRLAERVRSLGQDLVRRGAGDLVNGYGGEGPPWIDYPWPLPWPPKKFNPDHSIFETLQPGVLDQVFADLAQRLSEAATGTTARTATAR